ncbi:MAG: aldehyde ferredoxin oxidoreductase N-terminal domain-containing protein, partial [Methanosarcinaceae archaeon]|nr:aldehyde ferredoxin oxidoreductase N-terminal domain-containing protein [Methanosarcinaceae archaeon]
MPCRRGKTIRIDLGTGQIKETLTDEALLLNYLGGRGLGVKLLSELIEPELDPLAPENPLIFTSGPLTGLAPMAGRFVLTSKSPLTGTVFSYNAGGTFGKELKWAGIDALLISGKAKEPVYIKLRPEGSKTKVELLPAHPLWGKNTEECTKLLEVFGSVACIGRAGENQVRISSLVNDFIYLGRGGLGAVAGSKKLKAVVVKGEEKPEIFDSAGFKETEKKVLKLLEANSVLSKGFSNYGTPALVRLLNYMKVLPVQNFQANETSFAENYSGELIKARFAPEKEACFNCPIACKQREKEKGKPLPDYASLWAFGLNPEISDLDSVLRLSRLCIDYGLDPLSTGSGLAAYFEYKGKKPDALELEKLIKQIGEGKSKLGEGSRRYFEKKTGTTKLRLDVKGLELAGFDVREIQGQALAYATSPWGGDFLSAFMVGPELLGKPLSLERLSLKG